MKGDTPLNEIAFVGEFKGVLIIVDIFYKKDLS